MATAPSTRGIKILFAAVGVTFAVLIGSVVVNLVGTSPSREVDRIALDDVPEGPSLQRAGDRAVVLVRDGDDVTAFAAATPLGDAVVWCPRHERFATAIRASGYSIDGQKLGGPGPDELLRLDAAIVDGSVEVSAVYPTDWPRTPWSAGSTSTFENADAEVCGYVARY